MLGLKVQCDPLTVNLTDVLLLLTYVKIGHVRPTMFLLGVNELLFTHSHCDVHRLW